MYARSIPRRCPYLGDVRAQAHRGRLARPRNKLTDVVQWWLFIFEIKLNWPITCRSISPGDQASLLVNLRSIGLVVHTHTDYCATHVRERVLARVFADGRVSRRECGYSIRPRQCFRKLPGNTWAWCRDKCTLAFAYFSPSRHPYPPGGLRSRFYPHLSVFSLSPIAPPYYLPIFPPSPRSFRWLMYLVDHIIGDPNIGQTYTRSEVRTTTSADKCDVQNASRHFYDVSRRRSFIEAKRPGFFLRKNIFSRNPDFRKCRSYILRIDVNKNRSYEDEK